MNKKRSGLHIGGMAIEEIMAHQGTLADHEAVMDAERTIRNAEREPVPARDVAKALNQIEGFQRGDGASRTGNETQSGLEEAA